AEDLPEDDRVAGYRRNEDLLAEILLPVGKERDESKRRRLPHGLRENTGEYIVEKIEAAWLIAEARLEARAEDADKDQRKCEVGDHALAVAKQLDEIAMGKREDRGSFSHSSYS